MKLNSDQSIAYSDDNKVNYFLDRTNKRRNGNDKGNPFNIISIVKSFYSELNDDS